MAAEPAAFDFNQLATRNNLFSNNSSGSDNANTPDFDMVVDMANKGGEALLSAFPLFLIPGVPDLSQLDKANLFTHFDKAQGLLDQMIFPMASAFGMPGGWLARLAGTLVKNGQITDLAADVTGEAASGDTGGGASGESAMDTGGGGSMHDFSAAPVEAVSYGDHMVAVPMSKGDLGELAPSSGGGVSADSHGLAV